MFFIMTLLRPGYSENFPFETWGFTTAFIILFRIFKNYLFLTVEGKFHFWNKTLLRLDVRPKRILL